MKAGIHPQFYTTTITCASCNAQYTLGSTQQDIHVELCSNCHPFYTGQDRFVDTASRIDKFNKTAELTKKIKTQMSQKKEERQRKDNAPKTLAEMLAEAK